MARVLICHVPKDGSLARELGGALMGRGHSVSFDGEPDAPRADRLSRLRHFEAVIVLWTETSCQSAGLATIARETMPLNLLVPLRAEDLPVARLPLMYRKLYMFPPRDVDGIARLIARLSTAATSLKEMAEHAARIGIEPRWERAASFNNLNKSVAKSETTSPAIKSKPAPCEHAPHQRAMPEAIIPAQYAHYTSRTPLYLDLPEVDEADVEPALSLEREQQEPKPEAPIPGEPPIRASVQSSIATMNSDEGTLSAQQAQSAQHTLAAALPMPVQLAEQPAPYSAIANAQDLSEAVEAGLLLHFIPDKMWLGEPGAVEVRLVREVLNRFFCPGTGMTVETLSISLYGRNDAFEIERLSERTQDVGANPAKDLQDRAAAVTRWTWHVIPLVAGTQDLVVRVSALLLDRNGVPAPVALPDRRFRVDIDVPEGLGMMSPLSSGGPSRLQWE